MFLKASEVIDNAEKAFHEKRLQFQQPTWEGGCQYQGPCAIGVSLTPEQQKKFDNAYDNKSPEASADISAVEEMGLVETDNLNALYELQQCHDHGTLRASDFDRIREEYNVVR